MKSSPDPPPAPNPTESTQAQTASNIQTAIANARLNRINQQTPWGSINYTEGAPDASGVPSYSSQIQLSPQQQALLEQQQGQQSQRGSLSSSLLNQASGAMSQPLNLQNLHPVYDRYATGGQATPAVSRQPPPQPQAPAPQQQMPGRDQMLAMLMQFLQSQGQGQGPQGPTNPLARALNSGGSVPVTSPTTGATPQTGGGGFLPADQVNQIYDGGQFQPGFNPRGSLGNVSDPNGENLGAMDGDSQNRYAPLDPRVWDVATRTLRPEIAQKFIRDGKQYEPMNMTHGVLDQGKVIKDPELGYITDRGNNRNPPSGGFSDIFPYLMMLPAAAGAIGAAGAGAAGGLEGAAGVVEGIGAGTSSLTGGTAAAGTGAAEALPGWALEGGPSLSGTAAQPSWGSQLYNNWSSGRGLLGMNRAGSSSGPLLAQLLRAMQGGKGK